MILRRSGRTFWKAICPFHHDDAPKLLMKEDHDEFHCDGCGATGVVLAFEVMEANATAIARVQRARQR